MKSRICAVGGSGLLGAPVVRALLDEGHAVTVVVRDRAGAEALFGTAVEIVEGDVRNVETLRRGVAGCDAVHVSLQGGPSAEEVRTIEAEGTANVVAAAREAGLRKITLISGLSAALFDGLPALPERVPAPMRAKWDAERAVRNSGLSYTIFRPSNVIEGLERSISGRIGIVPSLPDLRSHWLSAEELGPEVARTIAALEPDGTVRSVLGPEELTIAEALTLYARTLHPGVHVLPLPVWLLSILAFLSGNPGLRIGVEMLRFADRLDENDPAIIGPRPIRLRQGIVERATEIRDGSRRAAARMAVPPMA